MAKRALELQIGDVVTAIEITERVSGPEKVRVCGTFEGRLVEGCKGMTAWIENASTERVVMGRKLTSSTTRRANVRLSKIERVERNGAVVFCA